MRHAGGSDRDRNEGRDEDGGGEALRARLMVDADLAAGARVELDREQAHYIARVLRIGPGDSLALFNGRDGEWVARVDAVGRNAAALSLLACRRPQMAGPDVWLLFAPLKRARTDMVVEKATELGAAAILPVLTARSQTQRVNVDRWQAIAREAAEQCERLDVPRIEAPSTLEERLAAWPEGRRLFVCAERDVGAPPVAALARSGGGGDGAAVLIGPEGGFTASELDRLAGFHFVTRIHLGPRILRAETAAIAALALVQACRGDWVNDRSAPASGAARPSPQHSGR